MTAGTGMTAGVAVVALALNTLELLLKEGALSFLALNALALLLLLFFEMCVAAVAEPAATPTTRAVIAALIARLDLILDVTFGSL